MPIRLLIPFYFLISRVVACVGGVVSDTSYVTVVSSTFLGSVAIVAAAAIVVDDDDTTAAVSLPSKAVSVSTHTCYFCGQYSCS